jgi:hypothetical protein
MIATAASTGRHRNHRRSRRVTRVELLLELALVGHHDA